MTWVNPPRIPQTGQQWIIRLFRSLKSFRDLQNSGLLMAHFAVSIMRTKRANK
jgi:hypothetical protein